ncbi:MAG: phosphate/phosphite/phosphonate ABC transporter substrate-binding protein [Bacteroidetes bacterium]|nr:phosphate/phosphite/phosphonate ABC transporter substrate-binding protein [Bacteroidota bacterium]
MKTLHVFILIIIFSIVAIGCNNFDSDNVVQIDFSKTTKNVNANTVNDTVSPLRVAVSAMTSPSETFNYYIELFDYISKKINKPVKFEQRKTYSEINEMLAKHQVDIAFICSGAYIINKEHCELLVIPIINGLPYYQAYIIANKNSSIHSLKDLKGKSFAFTDPLSNTGKLYPERRINELFHLTGRDFFSKTIYSHAHDISIQLVSKNVVDGASVDGLIYDYVSKKSHDKIKNIRIIEKSEYMGMPPVVVSKNFDKELKNKIEEIFLNIHNDPEGKKILDDLMIDKFALTSDTLYKNIISCAPVKQ